MKIEKVKLYGFIVLTLSFICNVFVYFGNFSNDEVALKLIIFLGFLNFVIQIILIKKILKSYMNPLVLFTIFLYLFTAGQTLLFFFNLELGTYNLFERLSHDSIYLALIFHNISMIFFFAGIYFTANKQKTKIPFVGYSSSNLREIVFSVGILLCLIGILPFLMTTYTNLSVFLNYGYKGYYQMDGVRVNNFVGGLSYYLYVGLLFMIISANNTVLKRIIFIIIISIGFLRLGMGDRGDGFVLILTAFMLNSVTQDHVNNAKRSFMTIGLIILLGFLVPIISAYRHGDLNIIYILLNENPLNSTLQNLGATLFPLVKTMELINSNTEIIKGYSYLAAFVFLIPSVFRIGFLGDIMNTNIYVSPAKWLMEITGMSYGPGYTPFAEAYLNFGWFGSILFALFGVFIGLTLSNFNMYKQNKEFQHILSIGISILTFMFLAMAARGSFNFMIAFYLRYVLFPVFLVLIWYSFETSREGRKKFSYEKEYTIRNK
ncbi:O-antigen polysaccharide polymerase Wzy [Exiguobacterium aurantiacum]|uniref:O-antigen polysaccharide polymerase Wzy n=1 Tax=Exiguobacterium aurantiacum TaxID=33987 RepID=UPI00384A6EA3